MPVYSLELPDVPKQIFPARFRLGGPDPRGDRFGMTNYYLEFNGRPYFGISGEFHYSRYPFREWDEALLQMKLAGIGIVATYVFWIHHEEEEGCFDWNGDNNLRYFVDLCAKHDLRVILRIGPFAHGECRNGGLPDWLYGRPFEVRSNDPGYLFYARRLYAEIGRQVAGQLFKDGGPIIGIQLENEYMHAAAPWELTAGQGDEFLNGGRDGAAHLRVLRELARECGLEPAFYTSTGWGGAPVLEGEILPLYGGYAFTPWNIRADCPEQEPTHEYLFQNCHDARARCHGFDPPYSPEAYPYACCEMGGGMQCWYQARFVVPAASVTAMTLVKIAGGCNFVGYYVFHGGSQPRGKHGFLNERTNPKISYDYQAPLGEFGQVRDSYRQLKLIFMFLEEFGTLLCPMATVLPKGAAAIAPRDTAPLRYAARAAGGRGFLFLNNYQDHVAMPDRRDLQFRLELPGEIITLPRRGGLTLRRDLSAILPFNLDLDGITLKYATAQPVTCIRQPEAAVCTWFFFAPEGMTAEYALETEETDGIAVTGGTVERAGRAAWIAVEPGKESLITLTRADGSRLRLCTLTWAEAMGMWKVRLWGAERILLSDADLRVQADSLLLRRTGDEAMRLAVFPCEAAALESNCGRAAGEAVGIFREFSFRAERQTIPLAVERVGPDKAVLRLAADGFRGLSDVLLRIHYRGDVGYAFSGGKLISDNFNNGTPWEIGLRRFYSGVVREGIELSVSPLRRGKTVFSDSAMAVQQEFVGEKIAALDAIEALPVYEIRMVRP